MNIFKISVNDNDCLIMPSFEGDCIEKKDNDGNVFFVKNNIVFGFNLFYWDRIDKLNNGRLFVDEKFIHHIEEKFSIKINNEYAYFKVGKVLECNKLENTHLSLCKVDVGNEVLDIVCGAKNVTSNIFVVVATSGVIMNNGLLIKKSKLKGYDSNGMLCSQKELGITGFNDEGIIILDDKKYKVGEVFMEVYNEYEW